MDDSGERTGFNAAVAGCFFALESVLRSSTTDAVPSLTTAMLLLSSVLASVVSQAGLGSDPAFKIPAYDFRSPAGNNLPNLVFFRIAQYYILTSFLQLQ
jgi:H+/Cl- antiporter ClcA